MNDKPEFMTHERIMAGEEYVSYSDYLLLKKERDEAVMDRANGDIATMTTNHYERLLRERNEALAQVKELIYIADRAIDLAELDFENDKFGIVSELRSDLEKIKEETK